MRPGVRNALNAAPVDGEAIPEPGPHNNVLVLDDNEEVLSIITRIAGNAGYGALGVSVAEDFKKKFQSVAPSVVILDVVLGEEDVLSVIEFLGKQRYPGAVFLISGYDQRILKAVAQEARDRGLHVAGTVEKRAGFGGLAHLLDAHFVGARASGDAGNGEQR